MLRFIQDFRASKLTGPLPAIDGSALTGLTSSQVAEGSNLYYTTARVQTDGDARYLRLTGGTLSGALVVEPAAADAQVVAATLRNRSQGASAGTGVNFVLTTTGDVDFTAVQIIASKEGTFTGTASTQDARLSIKMLRDGVLTERITIGNGGLVTITSAVEFDIIRGLVSGDTTPRVVLRAGGQLEWGSGSGARDTFLFRNAAGQLKLTGGNGLIIDSYLSLTRTTATDPIINLGVAGEANNRITVLANGQIGWGPGGSSPQDVWLSRAAAGQLQMVGGEGLTLDGALLITRTASNNITAWTRVSGDSDYRFVVKTSGQLEWGTGAAGRDTVLYRNGVGILKTDGKLEVAGEFTNNGGANFVRANATDNAILVYFPNTSGFANLVIKGDGKIEWGPGSGARDTNLYRSSANVLKTDDALVVVGTLTLGSGAVVVSDAAGNLLASALTGALPALDGTALIGVEKTANKGAANGYVPLGADSKIASTYLPAIAISSVTVVADDTARFALTDPGDIQTGDVVKVTGTGLTWMYIGTDPSQAGNYIQLENNSYVVTVNGQSGPTVNLTTSDIAEGTNLYYTQARFNTAFAGKSTTDLAEGTNLYWTQARFDAAFAALTTVAFTDQNNEFTAPQTIQDTVYIHGLAASLQLWDGPDTGNDNQLAAFAADPGNGKVILKNGLAGQKFTFENLVGDVWATLDGTLQQFILPSGFKYVGDGSLLTNLPSGGGGGGDADAAYEFYRKNRDRIAKLEAIVAELQARLDLVEYKTN